MNRVLVITPTYNEKENLPILAEKIFNLGIEGLEMLVVDDGSPDGTGQLAEELARKYPIQVLRRRGKLGLGRAYVAGFKKALSDFKNYPDYIIQMDADLSHDANVIPEMLKKTNQSCDVVLGSRYIKGGAIENWDKIRELISRFANVYARWVLWLPYRDLTGGFKCWRSEVLKSIDLNSLSSVGYNFQIETTYKAHKKGYKICETPIVFTERKEGESKFNVGIILESFLKVLSLKLYG